MVIYVWRCHPIIFFWGCHLSFFKIYHFILWCSLGVKNHSTISVHGDGLSCGDWSGCVCVCVCVCWGEQSALHWVTLFNPAHTSHMHSSTQPEAWGMQTESSTHTHAYSRAHRHTRHGHANTHTQACSPWGRGHFLSLVLSVVINPRQGNCLCAANARLSTQDFYLSRDYILVLHLYYRCIQHISTPHTCALHLIFAGIQKIIHLILPCLI